MSSARRVTILMICCCVRRAVDLITDHAFHLLMSLGRLRTFIVRFANENGGIAFRLNPQCLPLCQMHPTVTHSANEVWGCWLAPQAM